MSSRGRSEATEPGIHGHRPCDTLHASVHGFRVRAFGAPRNDHSSVKGSLMFTDGLFRQKRILVTGGGTGLGKGMAEKFLELGAELIICGRRKSEIGRAAC